MLLMCSTGKLTQKLTLTPSVIKLNGNLLSSRKIKTRNQENYQLFGKWIHKLRFWFNPPSFIHKHNKTLIHTASLSKELKNNSQLSQVSVGTLRWVCFLKNKCYFRLFFLLIHVASYPYYKLSHHPLCPSYWILRQKRLEAWGTRHSLTYEWPGNFEQVPLTYGGLHFLMCKMNGFSLLDQESSNFFQAR